jgi:hypothetical protein
MAIRQALRDQPERSKAGVAGDTRLRTTGTQHAFQPSSRSAEVHRFCGSQWSRQVLAPARQRLVVCLPLTLVRPEAGLPGYWAVRAIVAGIWHHAHNQTQRGSEGAHCAAIEDDPNG